MYVSPETLDLHLTELKKAFRAGASGRVAAAGRAGLAVAQARLRTHLRRRLAGQLRIRAAVLVKHGAPATIFLVSSYIGTTYAVLAEPPHESVAEVVCQARLGDLSAAPEPHRGARAGRGRAIVANFEPTTSMRWCRAAKEWDEEEIRALVEAAEKSCGDTSEARERFWIATRLQRWVRADSSDLARTRRRIFGWAGGFPPQELEREIVGSRKHLQDLSGQAIDLFCYPNGETSPGAIDLVRGTTSARSPPARDGITRAATRI